MDREEKKESSEGSEEWTVFDPDVMTEEDIEKIWWSLQKRSENDEKQQRKRELNLTSTDTTPTTDYSGMYFAVQREDFMENLQKEEAKSKTEEVLNMKKRKPKTYLTQVILYDNVNHDRILHQKLNALQHRHHVVDKRIKRRKQTFLQRLEKKQNEWSKLDATVISQFEPEKMPDLTFKFGRLYHNANYPYQAAIKELRGIPPPKSTDAKKPILLPQITRRRRMRKPSIASEATNSSHEVFITKLPKKKFEKSETESSQITNDNSKLGEVKSTWSKVNNGSMNENIARPTAVKELPPLQRARRGARMPPTKKNWLEDSRYITLTSLLGPRFSPSKKLRQQKDIITPGVLAGAGNWW